MTRDLVLLGASGNAREIIDLARCTGSAWRVRAVLDDDPLRWGSSLDGVPVTGPLDSAGQHLDAAFVLAVGSPASYLRRPALLQRIPADAEFATLRHPSAVVASDACVGAGSVLFANTVVGVGARVAPHVLVLAGTVVSHDVVVGACSGLASGVVLAGGSVLGETSYVGANASVNSCEVGARALVGMGAVVLRDVPPGAVVAGNPARVIRTADQREELLCTSR